MEPETWGALILERLPICGVAFWNAKNFYARGADKTSATDLQSEFQRRISKGEPMTNSDQGIVKNKAEEQPKDKQRAQTVHRSDPDKSVSREETRDSKTGDATKADKADR
jgi:hypothetical protein